MSRPLCAGSRLATLLACAALASALFACGAEEQETPERRPDVIFILIDALRADRVGWYGRGTGLTPFLDGLADEGSVFWSAYSPSSSTCPVVASLFTSRFPSQHGVVSFGSALDRSEQSLAETLRAAGYATAAFSANFLLSNIGYWQGFEHFRVYHGSVKRRASELTRDALAWIERVKRTRPEAPLFLFLHAMEPHEPLRPLAEGYAAVAARRGSDAAWVEQLRAFARSAPRLATLSREQLDVARELYDAEVASLDAPLRDFFGELARLETLDSSIVVVTSDHGAELFEHGGISHGHTLYDEVIHVPLLLKLPGQEERIDVREVVSLVDLAPTLLDASGIAAPAAFEGRSRLAALRRRPWLSWFSSSGAASRGWAYSELLASGAPAGRPRVHTRAIVFGASKLIESSDDTS